MNKKLLLCAALVVPFMNLVHADIYKWKDSSGNLRYSDIPPNGPYETVQGKKPAAAAPAPAAAPAAEKKPADVKTVKPKEEGGDPKKTEREELAEKVKKVNCETAQNNLKTYQQGGNIYTKDESGKEKYLTADEIAKGLEQSKQEIEKNCEK